MLALWMIAAAWAQPILSVGEQTDMGVSCTCAWANVFPRADGNADLFLAGGGNYNHRVLQRQSDGTWQAAGASRNLTTSSALIDHAITPCPDGSWVHVASANLDGMFDGALYMMHYSDELETLTERLVVENDSVYRYNDVPVVCDTRTVATLGHPQSLDSSSGVLMRFAEDGSVSETGYIDTVPPLSGSSLIWDPEREQYLSFRALGPESSLFVVFLDQDFQQTDEWKLIDLSPRPAHLSWPQSVIRLGDGYAIAHLTRREGEAYSSDQGDIQVTVLDSNLDLVQSVTVVEASGAEGAHRPSLARVGNELLVTYEVAIRPYLVVLQLDPELPPEPAGETGTPGWGDAVPVEDTGTPEDPDTDTGTDTDTEPEEPAPEPEPEAEADAQSGPEPSVVADAGPNRTVAVGATTQLDGRASRHSDGETLTVAWSSDDPRVSLQDASTPMALFTATEAGVYTVRLDVTAGDLSSSDDVLVSVQDERACGCATGRGLYGGWVPLLVLLGLSRRRRSGVST